jgi:hypothetical protein
MARRYTLLGKSKIKDYLYYMNKVQLKEYIKKAILEGEYLEDDPEAMDAMDDAMVADYEEEEANKFALDSEEPLEEATNNIPDDIQWSVSEVVGRVDDYAVEVNLEGYSPTTDKEYTAYTTAVEIGDDYEWDEVYDVEEVTMEEIVKRANSIVEAWTSKKQLTEEVHGGYIELMEMNPKFDKGLEMLLEVWNEWKSGPMTEPEMIGEAREDLLSYLASVLK